MSGLCGWFAPAGANAPDSGAISAMSAALVRHGGGSARSAAFACGALAVSTAGGESDLWLDDRLLVAIWGRPRWSGAEPAIAREHGLARALAEGYDRKGTGVLALLSGRFALAILDARAAVAVLATDRMASAPVCHADAGGRLVFGSTLDAISAFPGIESKIDRQAIYDYVHFHMVPAPRTVYAGRTRLLPGTLLHWSRDRSKTEAYWEMRYVENERRPFAELKEAFLGCVRESVRAAAADGPVGAFLSGGTDSSTIAGMLGDVTGEPARTFSIGFDAQGYDEMDYARIAARHFGTRASRVLRDSRRRGRRDTARWPRRTTSRSAIPRRCRPTTARGSPGKTALPRCSAATVATSCSAATSATPSSISTRSTAIFPRVREVAHRAARFPAAGSGPARQGAALHPHTRLSRCQRATTTTICWSGSAPTWFSRANSWRRSIATLPAAQMAQAYGQAHADSLDQSHAGARSPLYARRQRSAQGGPLLRAGRPGGPVSAARRHGGRVLCAPRARPEAQGHAIALLLQGSAARNSCPGEIITKTKHGFGLPFGPWLDNARAVAPDRPRQPARISSGAASCGPS